MKTASTQTGRVPGRAIVAIPARLAATRFPDKPLADLGGRAMILHVLDRAREADIGPVIVACGDRAIAAAVEADGGLAVMTDPDLPSGSDRVYEAVERFDPERRFDLVVNLQGDLPTVDPATIRATVAPLADPGVDIATAAAVITRDEERADPNVVKAVVEFPPGATVGRALYFTRVPAPAGDGPLLHHIGLYTFRREALAKFVALPPAALERRERLEQLRALAAGMRVEVALVDSVPLGVDTPADLERARTLLSRGPSIRAETSGPNS